MSVETFTCRRISRWFLRPRQRRNLRSLSGEQLTAIAIGAAALYQFCLKAISVTHGFSRWTFRRVS